MGENAYYFSALVEMMTSRRSVKKYYPDTIPKEELEEMLRLTSTAPSSWNLQHWRYVVVASQEMKERLLPIAYNQQQVAEAAATIVILGDLEADKVAREIYGESLAANHISQKVHDTVISQIEGAYQKDPQIARDEAICNASLAAMQFMLIAKSKGYDTCPMGGFDTEALRKELAISTRYFPVMLITIGIAASEPRSTTRLDLDRSVLKSWYPL